jgi:hypothetical protein
MPRPRLTPASLLSVASALTSGPVGSERWTKANRSIASTTPSERMDLVLIVYELNKSRV